MLSLFVPTMRITTSMTLTWRQWSATARRRPRHGAAPLRRLHQTPCRQWPPTVSETQSEHKPSREESGEMQDDAPKPKISNLSVPGVDTAKHLSSEQKEEVRKHNEDFEKRPEHGQKAKDDKVDKNFWAGQGTRENPGVNKTNGRQ